MSVVFRYYNRRSVPVPLPDLFGEAFKLVVGGRQLSHQYALWRALSTYLGDRRILAWRQPDEVVEGEVRCLTDVRIRRGLKFFLFNLSSEYMTNAFYMLQEGRVDEARQLVSGLESMLNTYLNMFKTVDYDVRLTIGLDVETYSYDVTLTVYAVAVEYLILCRTPLCRGMLACR